MARRPLAELRAEKLAQLEAIKAEIGDLEEKAAKRIGRIAVKAGLAEINLTDDALIAEFKAMAGRFRSKKPEPSSSPPAPPHENRASSQPGNV